MKRISLSLFVLVLTTSISIAQKWGFVDTEYILAQIPEYKSAQQDLDKVSADWQKEIEAKYAEIDKLYKAYQAEQILLTDEMRKKRENEIIAKEKEAKDIQKAKFGVDGELFKKRQDLVKPIQDKVYTAVKTIAEKKTLDVVFDKASDLTMLYTNPKKDFSDEVLIALGYKQGASTGTQNKAKTTK
ncbi:MAG: OmpH family outer membrane protein [Bacteroidetes bacterium]|nr:OmpH family outer membrane protein [Bacteroidota bacterium]